jgi:class 3 adenylate cyclase
MRCPNCQTENPSNARFCLNCGTTLIQHCPNCQGELAIGARYCNEDRRARLAAAAPEFLTKKVRAAFAPGVKSMVSEESRVVTIMVADVVASTELAKQVGANVWGVIVTKFFESITPLIYKYEGTIPRLLGDTLMAFYGAPVAHEDDPMRAVYAALDIRTAVQQLSEEYRNIYNINFKHA